jgi:AraC-like DNA-binding protein/mannose-6-phosphate isomerase-like protein (cupin superfamily)
MLRYVPGREAPPSPQLLQVFHESHRYTLSILHATLDERRERGFPEHALPLYHVVLFTRGRGRFMFRGRAERAQPGTLVLAGPGEPHDFGTHGGGSLVYHEVTFEMREGARRLSVPFHALLSLYAGFPLPPTASPTALESAAAVALEAVFRRLLERLTGAGPLDFFGAYTVLGEMFDLVVQALLGQRLAQAGEIAPLERARRFIEQRRTGRLSLAEAAAEAHLAPAYFCRAFKARFGQSPIAYHEVQRLQAAQRLLATSALSCKEVALRLGYADLSTFSKALKRATGRSPSRFRPTRDAAPRNGSL